MTHRIIYLKQSTNITMQRAVAAHQAMYRERRRRFEKAAYISVLIGFLGTLSYLIVHCHHAV